MNIRQAFTCTALAASLLGATAAQASTPVSVVVSAPGATFSTLDPAGSGLGIYDTGVFNIASSAASFLLYVNTSSATTVDDFSLFSVVGSASSLLTPNSSYDYDGSTLVYNYSNLSAGNYQVVAKGDFGARAEVSYSIASVPEAGSTALALAGLGVAALMMRRRIAQ
jgi:PEP-CTERM motif